MRCCLGRAGAHVLAAHATKEATKGAIKGGDKRRRQEDVLNNQKNEKHLAAQPQLPYKYIGLKNIHMLRPTQALCGMVTCRSFLLSYEASP